VPSDGKIQVLKASTSREIEAAFATLVSDRAGALFIAPDAFFATLAKRDAVPTAWASRDAVEAGGFSNNTTDTVDMFNHVGFYTGIILDVPQTLLAIANKVIAVDDGRTHHRRGSHPRRASAGRS
jgi:hypothetical protein